MDEIDWLIECCLMSSCLYFMHIQDKSILMRDDEWTLLCTRPTSCARFFKMLAHKSNSPSLYLDKLWLLRRSVCSYSKNAGCLGEKQQIPILMSLVWQSRGSNSWSSELEVSMLTIKPLRWSDRIGGIATQLFLWIKL